MSFAGMMKHPSAFLPVAMSCGAIATVGIALALVGSNGIRQPDEGGAAHLWQLLMAGQVPIVAFFAIKWLPKAPRQAVPVLVLQALAGIAALAPVLILGL